MNSKQTIELETMQRSVRFLEINAPALGPVNRSGVRAELDASIRGIRECAVIQKEAEVALTSRTKMKDDLRKELGRHHMVPICSVTAKRPLLHPPLTTWKMPSKDCSDERLLAVAAAMAQSVSERRAPFIAQQLPPDFIEQLQAAIASFRQLLTEREISRSELTLATLSLAEHISVGRNALSVVDKLVTKQLHGRDPALLATWRVAKRYHLKPGAKRKRPPAP